jgi:hypothetical protein
VGVDRVIKTETPTGGVGKGGETVAKAAKVAIVAAVVILALGAVVVVTGCASEDRAAAERARAEAEARQAEIDKAIAQAQAYQVRTQANTEAAAERAAIREADRAATFERVTVLLPWAALFLGAFGVAGLAVLVWGDLRARQPIASGGQPIPASNAGTTQAPALTPPAINVFVLPPPTNGSRRSDQWRQLEAAARKEVTIYDDRRQ